MDTRNLGIMIPTLNRSRFVVRQLSYYETHGFGGTVYIGDQSNSGDHFRFVAEWVNRSSLHVHHVDYRERSWWDVYCGLPDQVTEPYVTCRADDDFVVMDGAREALRLIGRTDGGIVGPEWYAHHKGRWATLRTLGYLERSLHGSPESRLRTFKAGFFPVLYGVWPLELVRAALRKGPSHSMRAHEWESSCALVAQAQCSLMETPLGVRVSHPGQISRTADEPRSWHQWLDDHLPVLVRWGAERRGEIPPECVREVLWLLKRNPISRNNYEACAKLT